MKFAAFAILLVAAGACAYEDDVDVAQPAMGRIYDLWVKDIVNRFVNLVFARGWEPFVRDRIQIERVLIARQAEIRGEIRGLRVTGISGLRVQYASFNILWGRLDFHIVHDGVRAEVEGGDLEVIYGERRGRGVGSGSLEIGQIEIKGYAILRYYSDGTPYIYNINANLITSSIKSDLTIIASQDYSERVNAFINNRVPELAAKYRDEIDMILGEVIIRGVLWWQSRN